MPSQDTKLAQDLTIEKKTKEIITASFINSFLHVGGSYYLVQGSWILIMDKELANAVVRSSSTYFIVSWIYIYAYICFSWESKQGWFYTELSWNKKITGGCRTAERGKTTHRNSQKIENERTSLIHKLASFKFQKAPFELSIGLGFGKYKAMGRKMLYLLMCALIALLYHCRTYWPKDGYSLETLESGVWSVLIFFLSSLTSFLVNVKN